MKLAISIIVFLCIGWMYFLTIANIVKPFWMYEKRKIIRKSIIMLTIVLIICFKVWENIN